MNRPVDNQALFKETTVDATVNVFANIGGIVAAARGAGMIGATGEGGIVTSPTWPEIDPVTGEPIEEPVAPPDFFRAGMKVGSAPVKS